MNNLDRLGRQLALLQDRRLADLRQAQSPCSPGLGEHLLRRSGERRRNRRLMGASVLALLLLAGGLAGLGLRSAPEPGTTATVVRAQAGQKVAAASRELALAFDDGSQVVLSSGASVRTDMVGPAGASLELERGRATVRVVHTRDTRWTVRAGAYAIAVTGTRFRVSWRAETGAFSLAVDEGSVLVSGGLLHDPVDIRAGQSLALEQGQASAPGASPGAGQTTAAAPPAEPAPEFVPVPPAVEPPVQARRPPAHASPESPRAEARAPVESWRAQAEAGRYRDALAEAERRGFDGICREAAASDLLTLAEAARYAGRSDRAEQALETVRARFGKSEDAALAAYLLGRIAAEGRRDHAAAARWFRTYLAERPGGRLEREAEGRLLESLAFMDRNTAREAARAYLEHHPQGPHAAFARNLLGP